ncbi:MAG: hypothetical protein H0V53_00275 [Rubrobacter sp.]|nr:hypothetical protein [Rubrobacter sp.]
MSDLNWRGAFRRAAIFTLFWLGLVYIMNVAFPGTFGIEFPEEVPFLLINAVLFFFLFTLFSAFTERRRARRAEELQAQKKGKSPKKSGGPVEEVEEEGEEPGQFKGQLNPNTSRRKKARRRR